VLLLPCYLLPCYCNYSLLPPMFRTACIGETRLWRND
jgi:hypothetical protein